jgi:membrane-associated phospholipid phosphatase
VRWSHVVVGTLSVWLGPLVRLCRTYWSWASIPSRGWWLRPVTIGLLLTLALLPLDLTLSQSLKEFRRGGARPLGGDVLLTLNTLGQFGDAATSIIVGWGFFLVARDRRRKILDWALCVGVAMLVTNGLKMGLGRLRPEFEMPFHILGPANAYPLPARDPLMDPVLTYSWQFWQNAVAKLWSMPSSHTVAAVVLAMILSRLVPNLRPMAFTCAAIVGFNRVLSGYHYPSDVVIGAVIGIVCVRGLYDFEVLDRLRWAFKPQSRRPAESRVGRLPSLANAVRVQRGDEPKLEHNWTDSGPPRTSQRG